MAHTPTPAAAIAHHRMALSGLEVVGASGHHELREMLDDYVDYLNAELSVDAPAADIGRMQEILLEAAHIIRLGGVPFDYRAILLRLSDIYARGFRVPDPSIFNGTAADYADVVEALGERCPTCNFQEALRQLLRYMCRLYAARKGSWKTVYQHILSIPEAQRLLSQGEFAEVREWVESGVDNLFAIRQYTLNKIHALRRQRAQIEQTIAQLQGEIDLVRTKGKVVDLTARRKQREIAALVESRDELDDTIASKVGILDLVEEDMRDFESKLTTAMRSYSIRLVQPEMRVTA